MMEKLYDFKAKPTSLWLTVNRSCNFRCKWCYAECAGFKSSDDMPLIMAKRIANIVHDTEVKHITLIGGEPTLWPSLFKFNDYCKTLPINVGMVTNACLFGNDEFWSRFLKNPFKSLGISVKGINEKQFAETVGTSNLYSETLLGIKRLLNYYPNKGVSVVYSNLVSPEEVEEITERSHEMGAKSFQLSSCSVTLDDQGYNSDYSLQIDQFVDGLIQVYPRLHELYDGNILIEPRLPLCVFPASFLKKVRERKQLLNVCHVQNRSGIVFDTDGSILPCNSMVGIKIGKLDEDFSTGEELLTFLNNSRLIDDYREMLRYPSDECLQCKLNDICRGGCIQNWLALEPKICHAFHE